MEGLSYYLLGPLQVRRGSAPVPVGAGKPLELLALLLVNRNRALSTDALIEQLWDGRPPETAAKIVQNAVSSLRKAIGDGAGEVLVTRGRGYELVVPAGTTDIDRFQVLVEEGRAALAAGRADLAVTTLRQALALWRGEPLADVAYHAFARDEIARLEEQRLAATEERIDADLATGGGAGLVAELEQLVDRHPLRERLRGQLMLALYRSGRQARALEVYAEGRRQLSEQLGIEPGEALKQLDRAILAHDERLGARPRDRPAAARRRAGGWLILAGAGLLAVAAIAALVAVAFTQLTQPTTP
jgi:DNA-binding SARP family transcriptional activator